MFKTTLIAAMALAGAQAVNISTQRKPTNTEAGHDDEGNHFKTGSDIHDLFDDGTGLAQIS